jgi:hypothetical protein
VSCCSNIQAGCRNLWLYRVFQKELHNFESLYNFIQRRCTVIWTLIMKQNTPSFIWNSYSSIYLSLVMQRVSETVLEWYSKCYRLASVIIKVDFSQILTRAECSMYACCLHFLTICITKLFTHVVFTILTFYGNRQYSGLKQCAASRKVAGSIPFSTDFILPAVVCPWDWLGLWQKWEPEIFLEGNGGRSITLTT